MRFSSAFAVVALTGALFGQMTASRAVAGKAQADYTLDDGIGAVALYPGLGYRSFVPAKFLVSSLHDLESQISQLPRGTTLHWLPHEMGIQSVERQTNRWQVAFAAQNGNIAILSLDDSYNLISTKVTLDPNADSVGGCKR